MDLTTQTPAQIDTELARIWGTIQRLQAQQAAALKNARYYAQQGRMKAADRFEAQAADIDPQIVAAQAEATPYADEFVRRCGWNRYFLCTAAGGHVHRGMGCTTCFPTTQYAWLIDLADCDEALMVTEYGERACTVCFPNAPTFPAFHAPGRRDAEAIAARQAEKDAKAAAKAAKALVEPVRVMLMGHLDTIETVAQAKTAIRDQMQTLGYYGADHPFYCPDTTVTLRAALIRKGIPAAEVDALRDRALAKARRESA